MNNILSNRKVRPRAKDVFKCFLGRPLKTLTSSNVAVIEWQPSKSALPFKM